MKYQSQKQILITIISIQDSELRMKQSSNFLFKIQNVQYQQRIIKDDQQEIERVTNFLVKGFLTLNDLWKKMEIDKEQAKISMGQKVKLAVPFQLSFALYSLKNQIIMISIIWDLVDYMAHKQKLYKIGKLQTLAKYSAILQDKYFRGLQPSKGQIAYGDLTTIDKQNAPKHLSSEFWEKNFAVLQSKGYKSFIVRASNPISTRNLIRIGGKVEKSVIIQQGKLKGYNLDLVRVDFIRTPQSKL